LVIGVAAGVVASSVVVVATLDRSAETAPTAMTAVTAAMPQDDAHRKRPPHGRTVARQIAAQNADQAPVVDETTPVTSSQE
jgi:hypothetical protein